MKKTVLVVLANRVFGLMAGGATLLLVGNYFTAEIQGYYYVFYNLIALQVLGELGLYYSLIQFAGHEMVKLHWTANGVVAGDEGSKKRLQSLLTFACTWFAVAGLGFVVVLIPVGLHLFDYSESRFSSTGIQVHIVWTIFVISAAVNMLSIALLSILEGCGKMYQAGLLKLLQATISLGAFWYFSANGFSLYSVAYASCLATSALALVVALSYRRFFVDLYNFDSPLPGMNWKRDIFPFQWRISVSWVSGYFIVQLFTPILLLTNGPVAAGQMGMTLQIILAINSIGIAWINAYIPTYCRFAAEKNYVGLDALSRRLLHKTSLLMVLALFAFGAALHLLPVYFPKVQDRLLPLPYIYVLLFAALANHIVYARAAYLRSHKEEPYLALSVSNGVFTLLTSLLLIPTLGTGGAVASYATATFLVGLGFGGYIFHKTRSRWMTQQRVA